MGGSRPASTGSGTKHCTPSELKEGKEPVEPGFRLKVNKYRQKGVSQLKVELGHKDELLEKMKKLKEELAVANEKVEELERKVHE